MNRRILLSAIFLLLLQFAWGQIPKTMSYQGILTDTTGNPVANGDYSMIFRIYDVASGGAVLWIETQTVNVIDGIFNAILGKVSPLNLAFDKPYWLGLSVEGGAELTPRTELTAAAYSLNAAAGGGASWNLTGNSGTIPGTNFLGTTDNQALELRANNKRALRIVPGVTSSNLIGGYSGNSITAGIEGATIAGGGDIAMENFVAGSYGVVSGGRGNEAIGALSTVGGGGQNQTRSLYSTVGGGSLNRADTSHATVSGGTHNIANGVVSTVCGGDQDTASGAYSAVSGGKDNKASGSFSTVGGGNKNRASSGFSVVGGGVLNEAGGENATVGGGQRNMSSGFASTVGGGFENVASVGYATVPGGFQNRAAGDYSFAAGLRAKADHAGTFVWADANFSDFVSTAANQFLIRASGGVGIGANTTPNILTIVQNSATDPIADAWTTYSSRRWKTNIRSIEGAMEKIRRLRGVTYDWKADGKHDIGLIAEEVGEVVPEVVAYEENGIDARSVDYARLVALLIEAVKEQQKEIEELKGAVKALSAGTQRQESKAVKAANQ